MNRLALAHRVLLLMVLAGIVGTPLAVSAQEPNRRPYRRIFGGMPERPGDGQRLDAQFSVSETYDDTLIPQDPAQGARDGGTYPSGAASLFYSRPLGTGTFRANAMSAAQFYPQLDERLDHSHSGGFDFNTVVGGRTTVRLAQTVSYATFSTLLGLPGSVILEPGVSIPGGEQLSPGASYGISSEGGWQFNSHASLARQLGRRGSLEGHYGFARTDLADLFSTFNVVGARYSHSITRQATAVAGYSYQRGRGGSPGSEVIFHDVDLGMDYSRRLPGLRNTSVSLSTGSAVIVTEEGREVGILGDVRLVHLMGRTWTAGLGYHRGVEFMSVLAQVVASDTATATLNGFLGPRLESWVSASYSRGNLGSVDGSALTSYAGIARLQYALSSKLAIDGQYVSYFHEFGAGASIPGSLPDRLRRQAVRLGLTLLLPIVR